MSAIKDKNNININTACSFTGHRVLSNNFNEQEIKNVVIGLIGEGFDTFLVGMALGFDSKCFHILQEIKAEYDIKIIAVVPCSDQSRYFNKKQKEDYELKKALIENKRADNLDLMESYYSRKDKHFREKLDKLDKLDMIDKLDNSDIKEFIKYLVNEHFKNLDDGK